jgi:hypothetical protein
LTTIEEMVIKKKQKTIFKAYEKKKKNEKNKTN